MIELEPGQKLLYWSIYSLELKEFKTLKTYIRTNLANSFIKAWKFSVNTLILFICKRNSSFCLYIDYLGPNNLTIKNWYPLPLIKEFLDWLGQTKQLTQLDLTIINYWIRIKKGDK